MSADYSGPKTVTDTNGVPHPYEGYVKWLERELAANRGFVLDLRNQLATYRAYEARRYQQDRDYVGYHEDEYDR